MRGLLGLVKRYGVPAFTFILGLNLSPLLFGPVDVRVADTGVGPRGGHMRESDHLDLLIFVISAPDNSEKREVIRTTWLSHQHNAIRGYFVIGTLGLSPSQLSTLDAEQQEYDDLVLLNIVDAYTFLTNKVVSMIIHAENYFSASLFMKCDDDTFVNSILLEKEVKKMKRENRLYWGYFDGRAPVMKQGKWAEKRFVLCDRYLPYALGGGYIIGWDLVSFIAQTAPFLIQYKNEDVSMGTWMAAVNVNRIHDERFDTEWKSRGCLNNFLVTQNQSPEEMKAKWARISVGGKLCRREIVYRQSYNYNWELPPSQCCQTNKK